MAYVVVFGGRNLYRSSRARFAGRKIIPSDIRETVGLFMVGAAPGAPLLSRNLARKRFDLHMAASYQVWAALMVPLMIPIVVAAAAKLYGQDVWLPPLMLLRQIALKQFLPLLVGIAIARFAPMISRRSLPVLNMAGNVVLTA